MLDPERVSNEMKLPCIWILQSPVHGLLDGTQNAIATKLNR
jgi:hypothetical protein